MPKLKPIDLRGLKTYPLAKRRNLVHIKDFGTLEAGKLADLLVLTEDPRVDVRAFRSLTHVMRGGRLHKQAFLAQRSP